MPSQPQRASRHGRISVVCFGSVGGDKFDVGWGTDPQTPDFMYFNVFLVIYIMYLLLLSALCHPPPANFRSGDVSTDLLFAAPCSPRHFKTGVSSSLWAHPSRVPCDVLLGAHTCWMLIVALQSDDVIYARLPGPARKRRSRYGNFDIVFGTILRAHLSAPTRRMTRPSS